jgi:hypothetical protein
MFVQLTRSTPGKLPVLLVLQLQKVSAPGCPVGLSDTTLPTVYAVAVFHAAGSDHMRTNRPTSVPRNPSPPLIAAPALVVAHWLGLVAGVLPMF